MPASTARSPARKRRISVISAPIKPVSYTHLGLIHEGARIGSGITGHLVGIKNPTRGRHKRALGRRFPVVFHRSFHVLVKDDGGGAFPLAHLRALRIPLFVSAPGSGGVAVNVLGYPQGNGIDPAIRFSRSNIHRAGVASMPRHFKGERARFCLLYTSRCV